MPAISTTSAEIDDGRLTTDSLGVKKRPGVSQRFLRHRLAVIGTVALVVLLFLAILAPLVAPRGPYIQALRHRSQPPGEGYLLGTDELGRDVWARLVYAGRVSGSVGLVAVAIYVAIGTVLGAISGYYRGIVDSVIQRITDTVLSFPVMLLIITLVSIFGASLENVMLTIGFLNWPYICRLVRGQVLSIRERDYITAARCVGVSDRKIIFRHILPNVVAPLIVAATFGVAAAILTETSLSFLGLGVQPPTPSWGNMITDATKVIVLERRVWQWLPPGAMIAICVLSINFMGDGLRDAVDPHLTL